MLEVITFSMLLSYISYRIIRSVIATHYSESLLAAGVGVLSTQMFIIANYAGQFLRLDMSTNLNISLQVIGLILICISVALLFGTFISRRKMSQLVSFWGSTQMFIAQGVYGVIRHPIHLAGILAALGTAMMMANLIIVILGLLASGAFYVASKEEDRCSLENLGHEYDRYMKAVPAFNVVLGIYKSHQNR